MIKHFKLAHGMSNKHKFLAITMVAVLTMGLCTACAPANKVTTASKAPKPTAQAAATIHKTSANQEMVKKQEAPLSAAELNHYKVNESGEVMVIMYHALGKKNEAYVRTPESFKADLQTLYDKGFRPVSMKSYISGKMDVEKGKTPVVLTFDDGNETNFKVIGKDGQGNPQLDPNCNVALMEAFSAKHPDFKTRAIFFLNGGEPFTQKGYGDFKIKYLLSRGMEIGNHSFAHENFSKLSGKQVEVSLGKNNVLLLARLKKAFASMNDQELDQSVMKPEDGIYALALPFGSRPAKSERQVLPSGTYDGVTYKFGAILNVGWKPEVAPTNKAYDANSINRVQSGDGELQLKDWLAGYAKHPERRYVSDGNPDTLGIPAKDASKLNPEKAKMFKVLTY